MPYSRYSQVEHTFVVKTFYQSGLRAVGDGWVAKFDAEPPSHRQIYYTVNKFERTGSIGNEHWSGRLVTITTPKQQEQVVQLLVEKP